MADKYFSTYFRFNLLENFKNVSLVQQYQSFVFIVPQLQVNTVILNMPL